MKKDFNQSIVFCNFQLKPVKRFLRELTEQTFINKITPVTEYVENERVFNLLSKHFPNITLGESNNEFYLHLESIAQANKDIPNEQMVSIARKTGTNLEFVYETNFDGLFTLRQGRVLESFEKYFTLETATGVKNFNYHKISGSIAEFISFDVKRATLILKRSFKKDSDGTPTVYYSVGRAGSQPFFESTKPEDLTKFLED